jgi:hypothetical protein
MNRHSAKTKSSGRSTKTVRRSTKKTVKSTRVGANKTSKTGRRPGGKASRTLAISATATRTKLPAHAKLTTPSDERSSSLITPNLPVKAAPVPAHKYRVGETVHYTSPTFGRTSASGTYTIVKLLPSESDDYQYRIKSTSEAFERVAKESQLDKI